MKLEHSVQPSDIKKMLLRAGFTEEIVSAAFEHVKRLHSDVHQDLAAANGFLPPLHKNSKDKKTVDGIRREASAKESLNGERADRTDSRSHKGLFKGRLRRKDFILGFLFFFGIGYVTLAMSAALLSALAPAIWNSILETVSKDTSGLFLVLIPFILAPITVMMLSLIHRRLHNIDLPGKLSLLFLVLFVIPTNDMMTYGFWALYIALGILFVVLLLKKGSTEPNQYGPFPESRGSFFRRIFNI